MVRFVWLMRRTMRTVLGLYMLSMKGAGGPLESNLVNLCGSSKVKPLVLDLHTGARGDAFGPTSSRTAGIFHVPLLLSLCLIARTLRWVLMVGFDDGPEGGFDGPQKDLFMTMKTGSFRCWRVCYQDSKHKHHSKSSKVR
jgi:hypothetical protein